MYKKIRALKRREGETDKEFISRSEKHIEDYLKYKEQQKNMITAKIINSKRNRKKEIKNRRLLNKEK